ncbi:MAG: MBL fold metallo-hydrolase [Pseudomonadales bacterium]
MTKIQRCLSVVLAMGALSGAPIASAHSGPSVPEAMGLEEIAQAFGWDFDAAEVVAEKVSDSLYVLFGVGGNIAVSVGDDGVLIVDDQFPEMMDRVNAAIGSLGGGAVDFAINTHWHFDHADGNQSFGPEGTWIVAQANSREKMLADQVINLVNVAYAQKAYPKDALPVMTYDDSMQFHMNGEQLDLMHFGAAHTTGDTAAIFRGSNAVHLGDVFNNSGYPFIDAGNGGTLDGVIHFCEQTLAQINQETVVIPGHGPLSDYQGLSDYIDMLKDIRGQMMALIEDGASLDDVLKSGITKAYDAKNGDPGLLLNRGYFSLTHKVVDR